MTTDLMGRRCLLLDFDGPICAVFSAITDRTAAVDLAAHLEISLPAEVAASKDPFDVLRYSAQVSPEIAAAANDEFTRIECRAVELASPTDTASDLIREAAESGRTVAVVSNNSVAAINSYLHAHDLSTYVRSVHARTDGDVTRLKPSPYLLQEAMGELSADTSECVFIGDSVTDLEAGHAAEVPTIGLANRPEKVQRFAAHSPAAIITSMVDALQAMRESRP
ncbi:HAD family hydrolase [Nocardia flavorosea]|uniref:HAD family hydrolase n=1 Tax=Nocardia flavorosea TaxID=53429 RepID=UPI0024557F37|nr:HAD-IIIA family hydrolase [Nocardia flavorosea]